MSSLKSKISKIQYTPKFWIILIVSLIILLIFYYALLDRYTPYTDDAYIQTYVVQVAPQVEGRVIGVYVQNNQFIEEGQKLFSLDPRPYEYTLEQLKATLVQTQQEVDQLKSAIVSAEQGVKQAQADLVFAQRKYNDLVPLAEKNYIAQLELDSALDQLRSQEATLGQAKAELDSAKQALEYTIEGEFAIIREIESQIAYAEYNLAQTTVYAPSDGYISNLQLVNGAYVDVGDAVLTFVDDESWWVVANFRENSIGRIREGQSAEISIAMYPGKIFTAEVENADWGVSAGQGIPSGDLPDVENPENWFNLSQRFPVRLKITNLDEEKYQLRVGATVSVAVFTDGGFVLNSLAGLWLRIGSLVNYVY
ncbi:MAG: HlyD family secretion protein [Thermodesulfobacteriales bacterium]